MSEIILSWILLLVGYGFLSEADDHKNRHIGDKGILWLSFSLLILTICLAITA